LGGIAEDLKIVGISSVRFFSIGLANGMKGINCEARSEGRIGSGNCNEKSHAWLTGFD